MITAYLIIGSALVAATVWVYYHPETRQDLEQVTEQTASKVKSWPKEVTGLLKRTKKAGFQTWLNAKSAAERKQLTQQAAKSNDAFLGWINALSAEDAAVFDNAIKDLVSKLGLELDWVTGDTMEHYPDLKADLEGLVLLLAVSKWQTEALTDRIAAFKAYQAWQRKPHARSQRDFSQRLYSKLVEAELATAPSPDLFLGPEKKRHSYIVESIRLAALRDRLKFNDVVQQVVTEPDEQAAEIEAAPEPKQKKGRSSKVAAEGQNSA